MPLKPIFEKSPLLSQRRIPLDPGQVRIRLPEAETLLRLAAAHAEDPEWWAVLLRSSAFMKWEALEQDTTERIRAAVNAQHQDGAYADSPWESLQTALAVYALHTYRPEIRLLDSLMAWAGGLLHASEGFFADERVAQNGADLMALLECLYRLTGKAPLLKLCGLVRAGCTDWTTRLNTFSVAGMGGASSEALADGARSAFLNAQYSGSDTEGKAPVQGWTKAQAVCGSPCGGLCGEVSLRMSAPNEPVSLSGTAAWAEAFCAMIPGEESAWAEEELQKLLQNQLGWMLKHCEELDSQALLRLLRCLNAIAQSSVLWDRNGGAAIQRFFPGSWVLRLGGTAVRLTMSGTALNYVIRIRTESQARGTILLYIPSWAEGAAVDALGRSGRVSGGSLLSLDGEWRNGDEIRVRLSPALMLMEAPRQSVTVRFGPWLMALDPPAPVACCGEPLLQDGKVCLPAAEVTAWKDLPPVRPEAVGEIKLVTLSRWTDHCTAMYLFPRELHA